MKSSFCTSLCAVRPAALNHVLIGHEIEKGFGFHDLSGSHPEYPHKLVSIRLARSRPGGSTKADDHAIAITDNEMNAWDERRCQPTYQRSGRILREVPQTLVCARDRARSVNCPDDIFGEQAFKHTASGAPPDKCRLNALQIAALFRAL
jgi:hypothetical protein